MRIFKEKREDRPAVYVGTYGKYAEGSIDGEWVHPGDFDTKEDFLDYCVKTLHADEEDPEIMFQDADFLPSSLYSEYSFSDEAFEYCKMFDVDPERADGMEAYVELFGDFDERKFEDLYIGKFDSDEDMCWDYIENCGGISEAISSRDISNYFDYETFGRELRWDMNEEDENDSYYLNIVDDSELAEQYIEDVYGEVSEMTQETLERYFDISEYARAVMSSDVTSYNGYYFYNY